MPPAHRNPFEGVTDFVSELGRMRALGVHGPEHVTETSERTHASAWVPVTDILARGADLLIRVELAGVDPEDVELLFHHGVLTVSGTRSAGSAPGGPDAGEPDEYYVRERYYGAFRRVITLPESTGADQISAEFDDGLVEITVRGAARPSETTRIAMTDRSSAATRRRL